MIGLETTATETTNHDWEGLLYLAATGLLTVGIEWVRRLVMSFNPRRKPNRRAPRRAETTEDDDEGT